VIVSPSGVHFRRFAEWFREAIGFPAISKERASMGRWKSTLCVIALATASYLAVGGPALRPATGADEPAKASKETTSKAAKKSTKAEAKPAGDAKRRLPRYYGTLGLTDAQREKIYGVQAKYRPEIEKLEKQLADVRAKQEADLRKILSTEQKKQLADALEAAKSRPSASDAEDSE